MVITTYHTGELFIFNFPKHIDGCYVSLNIYYSVLFRQFINILIIFLYFRESIVTRILRDALGGSSNTVMIACINPAQLCLNETLNILRYAEQARNVRTKSVVATHSTIKVRAFFICIHNLGC